MKRNRVYSGHSAKADCLRNITMKMNDAPCKYDSFSADELDKLPSFNPDGTVSMYEVRGVLLGKRALIEYVNSITKLK